MVDDMSFCPKCGTKFVDKANVPSFVGKIENLKKYNLVIGASELPWKYVAGSSERVGNIMNKQNQICSEMKVLLDEIRSCDKTDDLPRLLEEDVYPFILNVCQQLCEDGASLFGDYLGYREFFDQNVQRVNDRKISPEKALKEISDIDLMYKAIAGAQGVFAWELYTKLDLNVISNNNELREMTVRLAQKYNDLIRNEGRRYTDFFLSPSTEHIDYIWEMYSDILKPLTPADIDNLDESGWEHLLDDQEKNHNGGHYKKAFLANRDLQRAWRRQSEYRASSDGVEIDLPLDEVKSSLTNDESTCLSDPVALKEEHNNNEDSGILASQEANSQNVNENLNLETGTIKKHNKTVLVIVVAVVAIALALLFGVTGGTQLSYDETDEAVSDMLHEVNRYLGIYSDFLNGLPEDINEDQIIMYESMWADYSTEIDQYYKELKRSKPDKEWKEVWDYLCGFFNELRIVTKELSDWDTNGNGTYESEEVQSLIEETWSSVVDAGDKYIYPMQQMLN